MNRKFIISLSILTIASSFLLLPKNSFAETELSKTQVENIRANCDSIKESLRRLQKVDSKTRVILGTTYQSILTKYITPLNIRFVKNNHSNQNLVDIQTVFANDRETFNRDFIAYSQKMEILIATNCRENPHDFYNKLEETRSAREKLNKSALKMNSNVSEHIKAVTNLKDSLSEK